jgi:hypothetical protein
MCRGHGICPPEERIVMTQEAVAGFTGTERFANIVEFGPFVRRLAPMLVMIFVVFALLVAFVLSAAKLGAVVSWGVALPASAAMCALLYKAKKRQFAATIEKCTLELSPFGAVLAEPHLRIEMPWAAVRQIGDAQAMAPLRVIVANEGLAKVAYAVAAASVRRTEEGLIGAGTLTLTSRAPGLLRSQVAQNEEGRAPDPVSGQPLRGILLSQFDPAWRSGRIGEWIRAYRPDLLAGQV